MATHREEINRVLVTGGAGCIGLEVCNQLSRQGMEVRLFDLPEQVLRVKGAIAPGVEIYNGSILDSSSLREAMGGTDAVIHLAAMLGVRRTELNKLRCLEINVEGTKRVLECAIAERVRKMVFASSSEVYGEPAYNPVDEQAPTFAKTVYAVSKLVGEELCKAYAQHYPWFSYTVLRYFNTYGPYQTAQFVIPKFVSDVLKNQSPVVYGDGSQTRSYCYVSDVAGATVAALFAEEADGLTLNIGNGAAPINLKDLAKMVIRVSGKDGHLTPGNQPDFSLTDRSATREIFQRVCNSEKAKTTLGFEPTVSLEQGLRLLMDSGAIFERWDSTELSYTLEEMP